MDDTYPYMLELFSRMPEILRAPPEGRLVPIPFNDEASSLSAILLHNDYYSFIKEGKNTDSDSVYLNPEYIIPLKAKAYLDLKNKKDKGENIDSRDINKHRNDVFRLYQLLSLETSIELPQSIFQDMIRFFKTIKGQDIQLKNFGMKRESLDNVLYNLSKIYSIS